MRFGARDRRVDAAKHPDPSPAPNARQKTVWEQYNEAARYADFERELEWGDVADSALVFTGLFAAFLSAFLLASLPLLQPSTADLTLAAIVHISYQLSNASSLSNTPFPIPEFTPLKSAVIVNAFFFASLALILCAAFLAILVKSWLREFDRGMQSITVPDLRAKERECRLLGLERWHVPKLIALLPVLLQASLVLFCVGLIVFLQGINSVCATVFLAIFAIMALLYSLTKLSALFDHFSPFSSLISRALRDWLRIIGWEIPKMLDFWVGMIKDATEDVDDKWDWILVGVVVAVLPFGVLIHLVLIIMRAVPWYPRYEIDKRRRAYQDSLFVRVTVPSLNRLEKATLKAPENTKIFLSIFDEALIRSVQICPIPRWSDVFECLSVRESDLSSLRRTRTLLRVIAFVPKSWDHHVQIIPPSLTHVILGQLEENVSDPIDIPLYHLLRSLQTKPPHYSLGDWDGALCEWHWNQLCIAIRNLEVGDDETLWFVIDLANFAGRHGVPFNFMYPCLRLLLAITTCLQTVMDNSKFEKMKLKPLIVATLQSLSSRTADFEGGRPDKFTEGSDLFSTSQEPRLETIDFRALQQFWDKGYDGNLDVIAHHVLPINAIICSSRCFYSDIEDSDVDHLRPLIPQTDQGTETPTAHTELVPRLVQVDAHEYSHHVLLEKYDNGVAGCTERDQLFALDGLKTLNNDVLANYEARSPWLRLYVDVRLSRPTTLQPNIIENMRWDDYSSYDFVANTRIRDYEDGKLLPEPALMGLFSRSRSLETHFRLFVLLKALDTRADPELARVAPLLTKHLVSHVERVVGKTFQHEQGKWPLDAYLFLMETIHPQWKILSQDWRSAFAQSFLAKDPTTFLDQLPNVLETYFERGVQYGISALRTKQPPPQGSAGTATAEPTTLVEKGSEPQPDTPWDIIRGYHEKWIAVAEAYLPFLTNMMQEAPEHMTKDIVARIKARLPTLPDYLGDESTRARIVDLLGRSEEMIENLALFQQAWDGSEII